MSSFELGAGSSPSPSTKLYVGFSVEVEQAQAGRERVTTLSSPSRGLSALSAAFTCKSPPRPSPAMGGAGGASSAGGISGCCSQVEDLDEEGLYSDDDEDDDDDDDPRYSLRRIPAPRDPHHYKCMVYARAIINAKLWAAQA